MTSGRILFCTAISSLLMALSHLGLASSSSMQANAYGGISNSHMKQSLIRISPQETDLIKKNNDTDATFGVGLAYMISLDPITKNHPDSFIQKLFLGGDYFLSNMQHGGEVLLYQTAQFTHYDYTMSLKTNRLMVNAQLLFLPLWQGVAPFVGASIGGARIRAHYYEKPRTEETVYDGELNLAPKKNTNFVYSFAVGVRKPITPKIVFFLSYLYTDFGSIYTSGKSTYITIQSPIKIKVSTQTGLLGISYTL